MSTTTVTHCPSWCTNREHAPGSPYGASFDTSPSPEAVYHTRTFGQYAELSVGETLDEEGFNLVPPSIDVYEATSMTAAQARTLAAHLLAAAELADQIAPAPGRS
jgi:hypothetical protein